MFLVPVRVLLLETYKHGLLRTHSEILESHQHDLVNLFLLCDYDDVSPPKIWKRIIGIFGSTIELGSNGGSPHIRR